MPTWPSSLPSPEVGGFSGGPQSNKVSFSPEIGPTIDRKRASSKVRTYDVRVPPINLDDLETFRTFFEEDLDEGILSFTMEDPLTGDDKTFKFAESDPAYREEAVAYGLVRLSFKLQLLD